MIKNRYLIILVCLSFSNISYGRTEVKPPDGPFNSMLRATFKLDSSTLLINEVDEKKYNFQVPDLGRYQERSPKNQIEVLQEPLLEKRGNDNNMVWNGSDQQMNNQVIRFDPNAFTPAPSNLNSKLMPFPSRKNIQYKTQLPLRPENKSFDAMPIGFGSSDDVNSYPPEWANSIPFNSAQNYQNQGQPMMGMPFPVPSQMPIRPLNNNSNSGYK